jgi:hypothetical protein
MVLRVILLTVIVMAVAGASYAQGPVWELGKQALPPDATTGTVSPVDGTVTLDGTNAFSVPASVLAGLSDYTIEFEVKRDPASKGVITLASNMDPAAKTGLSLVYHSPDYNALVLFENGYQTVEQRGFLDDKFNKVTVVVRDRKLTLFRNGLILAMTGEVADSAKPLVFGSLEKAPVTPIQIRNVKIYSHALFPTGYDSSAVGMRYVSGPGYAMQRVEIKDPKLPRVLIVGDSISMGYRRFVTERFKGIANVDYWVGGGFFEYDIHGDDFPALKSWDGVLSNGPYDVVTWNASTLHMWNGAPGRCSEANYPANMTRLVEHIQKAAPNTRLIWIRCTPWRTTPTSGTPTLDPSHNDAIVRYNALTDQIMAKHGISEIDLYTFCLDKFGALPPGTQDALHWPEPVCRQMADLLCPEIEKALAAKRMTAR